jgi:hypothetical protein
MTLAAEKDDEDEGMSCLSESSPSASGKCNTRCAEDAGASEKKDF